jgi:hypothetical protein
MRPRWDYRSVEGALYSLGRPADVRPAQPRPPSEPSAPHSGPRSIDREVVARTDLAYSLRRSLDADELEVVRSHYIVGARRLSGRDGYRRREQIIKKLVSSLNNDHLTNDDSAG